ncbi:hypothetical protein H7J87_11805 [Mycolicibacterium wolinskyi]|uniref:Uncharacterized protein n=1 Tax=Mycolicibacterium wolinskyi TaxID=59750 RepID=A0A1X2FJ29_9MYCO|nr:MULTISPECIES: hypothetical protein [Mycolicibacterium]MCV7286015.1 hypothetical protein [Mycolicibacterium wolinskyi]MCV7296211.1 hypothetical protein [Mycolicibacterium goodii]ORX18443.1 hypothetical protein AWC31_14160 [Mycolicibacterium wolinskyi]
MALTPGKLWAVYVIAAVLLCGGVTAGVLMNHKTETPPASQPPPPPSSAIRVGTPATPSSVYPQPQQPAAPSCRSVTAVDAQNVSRQFVLAVGNAYAETPEARQCQAATVVAHSDVKDQDYTMTCVPESSLVKCTGGQSAVIVFRPGA